MRGKIERIDKILENHQIDMKELLGAVVDIKVLIDFLVKNQEVRP